MNFYETIENAWIRKDSMVCVGLDPDLQKIPAHLKAVENPIFEFNRALVDATADLVCAYKPQFAYYVAPGYSLEAFRRKKAERFTSAFSWSQERL